VRGAKPGGSPIGLGVELNLSLEKRWRRVRLARVLTQTGEAGETETASRAATARDDISWTAGDIMSTSPAPTVSAPGCCGDVFDQLAQCERLLTAKELARILAISPKTIYSYVERNMIPYYKIEANVRFRAKDVAEWLRDRACLRFDTAGRARLPANRIDGAAWR